MNNYTGLVPFYDKLMGEDVDYEKWTDYLETIFKKYNKNPNLICDLACGTGNITLPLAKRGYDIIGVDKSADMLCSARKKAAAMNLDVLLLNQSFSNLDLFGSCDVFLCMLDGFNYVLFPNQLYLTAKKIKECFLEPGGLFIFDISSKYKLQNYLGNNTFIYDKDGIFYAWENKYIKDKNISDMYINFFVKSQKGYRRFSEHHLQKAYTETEIKTIFKRAGYKSIEAFSPLSFEAPKKQDMRCVFIAQ